MIGSKIDVKTVAQSEAGQSLFWVSVNKYIKHKKKREQKLFAFSCWLKSHNRQVITANYLHQNRIEFAATLGISVEKYDTMVKRCIQKGYLLPVRGGYTVFPIKETKRDFYNNYEGLDGKSLDRAVKRRSGSIPSNYKIEINKNMTLSQVEHSLQELIITSLQAERISAQGNRQLFEMYRNGMKNSIKGNSENFSTSVRQIAERSGSSFSQVSGFNWSKGKVDGKARLLGKVPHGSDFEDMKGHGFVMVQGGTGIHKIQCGGHLYQRGNNVFEREANIYEHSFYNREISERLMEIKLLALNAKTEKKYQLASARARKIYKYIYKRLKGRNYELIVNHTSYNNIMDIPLHLFQ